MELPRKVDIDNSTYQNRHNCASRYIRLPVIRSQVDQNIYVEEKIKAQAVHAIYLETQYGRAGRRGVQARGR